MGAVFAKMISFAMMSIFTQNAIFDRAFGANVAIYASRRDDHVMGFTVGITSMTTLASIASYFLDRIVLPLRYGYLFMPLIYIGIIGALYIVGLFVMWKFFHSTFKKIKKFVHLAIFNCAVIGALFLNASYGGDIWSYIGYGFGTGVGFFLASFFLNIAHERLDSDKIPKLFRGYPIMMIYIGIVSLSFNILVGYTSRY